MQSLRLSHEQIQNIVDHAKNDLPNEACGLIGGLNGKVLHIIPIKNVANNPQVHYLMDANEQLQALKQFDQQNIEWLGVYHSHPNGKAIPSQEDSRSAELNTPNLCHVIVGLKNQDVHLQAWHIHNAEIDPVELLIGQQNSYSIAPMSKVQIWAIILAIVIAVILLLGMSFNLLPPAPPIPTP
ncbi:MAG: hypothetical protein Phog2KO_01570 [Phototrophicaceae bacterium]